MTLTLSDEAFANSVKQCESHPLHRAAKEKLIAKQLTERKTHTVELDGDDQIQIMVDELYDKGGTR